MRALPTNLPTIGVACVPAQARMDHAPCVHHDGTMMAPHNQPWLHHQCMMVLHGGGHGARVPRCGKDSAGAGQEKSKGEGGATGPIGGPHHRIGMPSLSGTAISLLLATSPKIRRASHGIEWHRLAREACLCVWQPKRGRPSGRAPLRCGWSADVADLLLWEGWQALSLLCLGTAAADGATIGRRIRTCRFDTRCRPGSPPNGGISPATAPCMPA